MAADTLDKKVLYIAEMDQLLPYDDLRKGRSTPLPWVKFRTGGDASPAGQTYQLRRQAVKAAAGGWAVLGVYDEMLSVYGGDRPAPLRGFIVNHRLETASAAQIGQALGCQDAALVRKAIRTLLAEGLLLQVTAPDFAQAIAADKTILLTPRPPCPTRHMPNKPTTPTKAAPTTPAAQQRDEAAAEDEATRAQGHADEGYDPPAGEPPGPPEQAFRPASGQFPARGRGTLDRRPGDGETPTAASAAPSPSSADGYGETPEKETAVAAPRPDDAPPADGQTADLPTGDDSPATGHWPPAHAPAGQPLPNDGQRPASPAPAPPKAEPREPTEADASKPQPQQRPGPDMSWHAESFAQQLLKALYPTHEDLVVQGRKAKGGPQGPEEFEARELGCLREAFEDALIGVGQVEAVHLLTRSLKEAARAHKVKCKTTRGRYWRWWFGQHMASVRRERAVASGPP